MATVRVMCGIVALVAAVAGTAMLIAPSDTDTYFSWPIGPAPLAATVGGFYVASAIVFGLAAASDDWFRTRGLCVGVMGLTLPTLAATFYDRDVFDFGRSQAVVWVVLFVVAPIAFGSVLVAQRRVIAPESGPLPNWARAVLVVLGIAYLGLEIAALVDPAPLGRHGPFAMRALSGRFIGSWATFLATVAFYSAVRNRRAEVTIPAVALTLWPVGAIVAAIRSLDDLASGERGAIYLAALVMLTLAGAAVAGPTLPSASARARSSSR